ncbi:MAG: FAD-binding protein [Oscillospiraceae bacterium]|nr:FAD-binding protein [Oscillospiraceae bacterium]
MKCIHIVGAGLAGLSAAITLASKGITCNLFSLQPSERAQSVLAEGGINGALDTMGEDDCTENHFADTLRGGVYLADPNAVDHLTKHAPEILRWLERLGVPFNRTETDIALRNFGGQKKKRTAYAQSSTGKIIMTAVIDEARKYEVKGLIRRFPHHEMIRLLTDGETCRGVRIRDTFTGKMRDYTGIVLLCTGGMNGVFPSMTTGTTQNSGDAAATAFAQGAAFSNLEMLQYHPTTIGISGKRCLVTEAARGEGGRLYIERGGEKWFFMEEKYQELGNLMPRDVVARTMFFVRRQEDCGDQVFLDMTGLPEETWQHKLSDLRMELMRYLGFDPKTNPIPVQEGIHYFMGGIDTDEDHRTNLTGLYAAGECTSQYHGANRLGGNSMLGALYGGRRAAETIAGGDIPDASETVAAKSETEPFAVPASPVLIRRISEILLSGLGIVRSEQDLLQALGKLHALAAEKAYLPRETARFQLAEAMLRSALERRESRGAHYREDYPETSEAYRKPTIAQVQHEQLTITFRTLPERRKSDADHT